MSHPLLRLPHVAPYTCRSCLLRRSQASRRRIATPPPWAKQQHTPKAALPTSPARTRFAPSPTGYLHLGSLRTALFNYLLAKRTGGQFLLRIEDTDQKRTVPDAEERLFRDLRWAGLQWDEGPEVGGPYGPYKQSQRSALYREHAQRLLDTGDAYRCFCSTDRLNQLAEHRHKLGVATDYDRTCAGIDKGESDDRAARGEAHTVRLKVPDVYPAYHDLIYGPFKPLKRRSHLTESSFEDPILLKSDGLPTYHLANVVDDHLMQITHVIRGSEWMPSTPKHIALYSAFGWTPPHFAHVGLLVDEQGNKLSKRNFDTDIAAFQEMDIFPETLTNFAALLGWSHSEKSDVLDLRRLVDTFSLKFTKGNTTVTFGKLHFLQRKHAALRAVAGGDPLQHIVRAVSALLTAPDTPYPDWQTLLPTSRDSNSDPDAYITSIVRADAENYTNANEFVYRNSFLFTALRNPASVTDAPDVPARVKSLADVGESEWDKERLMAKVHEVIDARAEGRKGAKDVYQYLRRAVTGKEDGMRIYDVLVLLGRDECLRRLGVEV
ncbi:hypothetical protein BDV95DRAFT_581617 [Massariosphaeria phaeospora]|uniref:Glutamate--tRNA ligase, mitochondrial n=1 Tax=Massariosphaeria phaeospora TaxID=100035 RepID=A0A7C8M767_9PLEO|nr:hypothetical protein BDV95DRAFT_581617 [Massariosphaeria phaeospora]